MVENVREEDSRIQRIAAQRLERHFTGQLAFYTAT